MDISTEEMSRDNKRNNDDKGGNTQLIRPQIALEENGKGRKHRGNDTADDFGTKTENDACHEAAHATEQAEIGEETLLENARKTHSRPTYTCSKANEYPHHQDDILVFCATVGAIVVFIQKISHQGSSY